MSTDSQQIRHDSLKLFMNLKNDNTYVITESFNSIRTIFSDDNKITKQLFFEISLNFVQILYFIISRRSLKFHSF